jgi:hypothetical protein
MVKFRIIFEERIRTVSEYSSTINVENANILILLQMRDFLQKGALDKQLDRLDHLCRQMTNLQKSLK